MNIAFVIQLLFALTCSLWSSALRATVVSSHSLAAETAASIDAALDQNSSNLNSDSLTSSISNSVGQASTTARWNWSGDLLTGSGSLSAQRTNPTGRASLFETTSLIRLQFTLSQAANYRLLGNWEFDSTRRRDDSMSIQLRDASGGILFSDSLTTNGSANFNSLGTLTTGDYTLEFAASMPERFNRFALNLRSGNWSIDEFRLAPISSTPEAGTLGTSLFILLALINQRVPRFTSQS